MSVKMEDVARRAGVSTATVSRVINNPDLVSLRTRQRVMAAIHELDYKVNLAARNLRTNQTRTIAIVIPTISEPVINRVIEAVEDVAIAENYTLLMCSTRGDTRREESYINLLTQQTLVDGVLYISPRSAPDQVRRLVESQIPLVLCNYRFNEPPVPSVLIDHASSAQQATHYLLSLGHRRIGLLNLASPHYYPARMRREGYESALLEANADLRPELIVELDQPTYATTRWHDAITALLDRPQPPTAIVAFNDLVALEVYAVCRARGLRIPHDLSITGCDDILSARHIDPPLTTIRVPAEDQGRHAMAALMGLLRAGSLDVSTTQPVHLDVTLVERRSCAPPPN